MNNKHPQYLPALLAEIQNATLEELRKLLETGLGPRPLEAINHAKADDDDYRPPLFAAVNTADTARVALLLDHGADIEVRGPSRRTALHQAYLNRDLAMAGFLHERGADARAVNQHGTRVFDMALICGDLGVLDKFLAWGQTLDYENNNQMNTLHFACRGPNPALVRRVLDETSFKLDQLNKSGRRPVDFAEQLEVFQYCLEQHPGLETNPRLKSGNHSIHLFARDGHTDIVAWLLDQGIDIQLPGHDKNTLLHQAAGGKKLETARMLVQRGAKLEARNKNNFRPLHAAASLGDLEMVRLLVESGAKLDIKGNTSFIIRDTETPLYMAVDNHHDAVARYLIEQGANPNEICNSSHGTALTAACMGNQVELVELLLKHGASPNGVSKKGGDDIDYFYFPLAQARSARVVDLLVAAGADVNAKNRDRQTALHMLADGGRQKLEAIQALVRHGADVDALDGHGRTPQSWADHKDVTRALMEGRQNPRQVAELSAPEKKRQDKQNARWETVKWLAGLLGGTVGEAPAAPAAAGTRLGKELFDRSQHCSGARALGSLAEMLKHATRDDVRYLSPDSFDNEATILHRVLYNALAYGGAAPLAKVNAVVRRLIELGADVNAVETLYGETPLHKAGRVSMSGYAGEADGHELRTMFQTLLDAGADIHALNEHGSSVLDFPWQPGLLDFLRQRGARFGTVNESLFEIIAYGSVEALAALLGHGPGLEARNRKGQTPLLAAAACGKPEFIECLLARGADRQATDPEGKTLLHFSCEQGLGPTVRHILAQLQPDLDAKDKTGRTALSYLLSFEKIDTDRELVAQARKESEACALLLVQAGARLDIADDEGKTPLAYARTKKLRELLQRHARH